MSQFRPGILIAIIVFAVFAGYAFLVPATYRANAVFVVEPAPPASAAEMPEPLEAARRLSEAILDRKTLEQLSSERAGSKDPAAQAQAAGNVRKALEIDTGDARAFSISYKDSEPDRTQSACNRLAKRAVEVAPQLLVDHSAERALDMKRGQQTQELAAFLSLHPEVAAAPSPSGEVSPDKDPALSALNAEKTILERRILELDAGQGSDNPYSDPVMSDPKVLKRRLAEIEAGLSARKQAFAAKPTATPVSPELRAEWKRLLDAVAQSSTETANQPHAGVVARVTQEATRPESPIDPNRHLLLFFGVVFGLGLGSAFTLVARSAQQRRTKSSRPPSPAAAPMAPGTGTGTGALPVQTGMTLQLPAMPALPSDLGPPVPLTPVRALPGPSAPPIVPMQQRPISSSPPAAPGPARSVLGKSTEIGLGGTMALDAAKAREAANARDDELPKKSPSSRPPPRRFASTLVLPPGENPSPEQDPTPDPVLASANQAWEQQIRAHEVPGFAVVKPGSEPPPPVQREASGAPAHVYEPRMPSSAPPPAATIQRTSARPLNQMKVTQPLGSFLPDAVLNERMNRAGTPSSGRSLSPAPDSRYSYVSNAPPAPEEVRLPPRSPLPPRQPQAQPQPSPQPPRSPAPKTPIPPIGNVIRVREVMVGWRPDREVTPEAQRALCAQLYSFAVENCFVLSVVSVPEATAYKSRVAAELALCLAETGHPRILLLEGDLHRPWVARVMHVDVPMGAGFSQQLSARAHPNANRSEERWSVMGCSKSLHVLAEGMMRTPGLLLSRQFADCLSELRSYYDFIVIDGPTASLDVDSGALDAVTDGLITVCPAKGSPGLARMQSLFSKKRFSAFATAP